MLEVLVWAAVIAAGVALLGLAVIGGLAIYVLGGLHGIARPWR